MIRQRDKKKKCICKNCEDCHHYRDWDITDKSGLRSIVKGCSIDVLADTLPKLIGSIDGCQKSANETRNDVLRFNEIAKKIAKYIPWRNDVQKLSQTEIKKNHGTGKNR